jgi:hypothetical protein
MTKTKKKTRRGDVKTNTKEVTTAAATVLVLRTCNADRGSTHGFVWPEKGFVECPDWKPTKSCGNGLHGWLWGEGDGSLGNWSPDARWLVVEVAASDIIDLQGKVKFPRGTVVHCGDRLSATLFVRDHGGIGRALVGGTATAGDSGTATAGYRGTATAGDRGAATAGDSGTATAGDRGTATAGDSGTATAGDSGTATAGDRGAATAGDSGTATAGDRGTATAGDSGTATAGDSGTATAGDSGTATAGDSGTATAGDRGVVCIRWWEESAERYRLTIGYVGENGIKPNTKYRVKNGKLVETA